MGLIVLDRFQRPDGALGVAESGQPWVQQIGSSWAITGKLAGTTASVTGTDGAVATVETNQPDITALLQVVSQPITNEQVGIAFRFLDANNWWLAFVYHSSGSGIQIGFNKISGGSVTAPSQTSNVTDPFPLTIKLSAIGNALSVVNQVTGTSYGTVTDSFNSTQTKHGLNSYASTNARMKDFRIFTPTADFGQTLG